jgi:hypothetical protein
MLFPVVAVPADGLYLWPRHNHTRVEPFRVGPRAHYARSTPIAVVDPRPYTTGTLPCTLVEKKWERRWRWGSVEESEEQKREVLGGHAVKLGYDGRESGDSDLGLGVARALPI